MLPVTQQLKQLESMSAKSGAANKVTTKYKKQCEILWLLRIKASKSDKLYTRFFKATSDGYVYLATPKQHLKLNSWKGSITLRVSWKKSV